METSTAAPSALYSEHVNPQWVRLLEVMQMNRSYARCEGVELHTTGGETILDFLSGYCVYNAGHNHPHIVEALKAELDRKGPAMLQSHVPELAGELAAELCRRAGGNLDKAFFCSSGSEGVEAVIKFARAHTRRNGLLYASGAFHGLTCGALSLMDTKFWSDGFGPMLGDTAAVPFGDLEALRQQLKTERYAACILEPVQGEGGIRVPEPDYLREAQALCRRHGTLFVLDEVQTGMYRTGRFLAGQHFGVEPDMVVLAKALSGGLVPVGAVLMTDEIYRSVFHSLKRAIVHTSTYSDNALAMRAGLATLEALDDGRLGERAAVMGERLRGRLREELEGFEMVAGVNGLGLLNGIQFRPPSSLGLRLSFETFQKIHPGLFGQVLVMRLFRDEKMLTQICGNNFLVLKAAPPLVVDEEQVERFAGSAARVVELAHHSTTFWSEALGLVRRVVNL